MTFLPPLAAKSPLTGPSDTSYPTEIVICKNIATRVCSLSDLVATLTPRVETSDGESYYIREWKARDNNIISGDVVRISVYALGWEVGFVDVTIENADRTIPIKFQIPTALKRASVMGPAAANVAGLVTPKGVTSGPSGLPPISRSEPTPIFAVDVNGVPLLAGLTVPGSPLAISGVTSAEFLIRWLTGGAQTPVELMQLPEFTQLVARIEAQAAAETGLSSDAVTMQLAASIAKSMTQPSNVVNAARAIVPSISSSSFPISLKHRHESYAEHLDVTSWTRIRLWGELSAAGSGGPYTEAKEVPGSTLLGLSPTVTTFSAVWGQSPISHTLRLSQNSTTLLQNNVEFSQQVVSLLLTATVVGSLPAGATDCMVDGVGSMLVGSIGWAAAIASGDPNELASALSDIVLSPGFLVLLATCAKDLAPDYRKALVRLVAVPIGHITVVWDGVDSLGYISSFLLHINKNDLITFCVGEDGLSQGECPLQTAQLSIIQPANGLVGQPLPTISVALRDQQGNPVTSPQYEVTVALANNPSSAVLSGTMTVSTVNGVANFPNLVIDRAGEGFTLTATAAGLEAVQSAPFNINERSTEPPEPPCTSGCTDPDGLQRGGFVVGAPITDPTDPRSPSNPNTPVPHASLPPDWRDDEPFSLGDPQFYVPSAVAGPQGRGGRFDFHARGDYVLLKSLDPSDDLEVHGRFEFPYSRSGTGTGTVAVAARVHGDVVRIHRPDAIVPGFFYKLGFEVEIDGEVISVGSSFTRQLRGGGVVVASESAVRLIWQDGTELRFEPLGVRVKVARARFGEVEGILGRGLVARDGRIPQSVADLYTFYRDGWRVPLSSPEALFQRGPDPFDSLFPYAIPDVSQVSATARAEAEAACRNAGVRSELVLASCVFDYFATGDPQIVTSYAQFDPSVPSIDLSPAASYVRVGEAVELSARILGTADQNVVWSATGGTLTGTTADTRTFRAILPGEYLVSASLGDLRAEARVIASAEGAGAYWRFEPSNPFRDEFGSATLTAAGIPTPSGVPLPTSGPGSAFPGSVMSLTNERATSLSGGRYTTVLPVSAAFTIEALVHFRTLTGTYGKLIAGYSADANTTPWNFQIRLDRISGTQRSELILGGGHGVNATPWLAASGIVLQTGRDYHLAASLSTTGQVTFYATDLTAGTPTIVRTVELGTVTVATNPSTFVIGDNFIGDYDFELDAVIDEVRLTPRVLRAEELLLPRR